jgi:GT2 family glycosyltransferase
MTRRVESSGSKQAAVATCYSVEGLKPVASGRPPHHRTSRPERLSLPGTHYDIVGSIVLHNTPRSEVEHAISQFLAASSANRLKTHLCVIDNSPVRLEMNCLRHPSVSYCFTNCNLGYGRAHNIALRASHGHAQYSLVLNTDVTYSPQVIAELKSFLDSHPDTGIAAPKILYPDGRLQHVCRLLPTPLNVFLRRFLPKSHWTKRADEDYELRWWDHGSIASIPFLSGSFLLLRTDLCATVGGFDERFFLYAEDVDLCRKIHQVADTAYIPHVSIIHEYRRRTSNSWRGTWHGIRSHCQYFNKWGWFFDKNRDEINFRTINNLRTSS